MSHGKSDQELINGKHNTARFFVEKRQVAWVLLILTCLWGVYGYISMPQRKDPEVQVRTAVALVPWPGASAEKVEQLVTKKVEEQMAANAKVTKIESISRTGLAVIYVELDENLKETGKEFDDIKLKLDGIHDLPSGAGPINFIKDFGDTAALMLTVASPKADEADIDLRAQSIAAAIDHERAATGGDKSARFTLIFNSPVALQTHLLRPVTEMFLAYLKEKNFASDVRVIQGDRFLGFDCRGGPLLSSAAQAEHATNDGRQQNEGPSDAEILGFVQQFIANRLQAAEFHPDASAPIVVRNTAEVQAKLKAVAGDKYSYRQMDDYTDLIEKTLKTIPQVSKVSRSGILNENVFLLYSQERLASYNIQPGTLEDAMKGRNISTSGGQVNVEGKNVTLDPGGEFKSVDEIGNVQVRTANGSLVYVRDLVDVVRGYESPARFQNFFNWRDSQGHWQRSRAITLSVQMRSGEQIAEFGKQVDLKLDSLKQQLPADLIYARTSDQPLQVEESIDLFMKSLYEAIGIVVIIALIGFWEWRSALLMAFSIPITLAMTFGFMHILGIDLQQVSIATLIIALGLLVDDQRGN